MNENVESSIPTTETSIENDDFFAEVNEQVIDEQESQTSDVENEKDDSTSKEISNEEEKSEDSEIDFKPFLEELSKKVKYNKESINVDSIEDVISNFQKGLNYDKLQSKLTDLQNSKAETYINRKAKELGMSVDEYMDQVERYEAEQQRAKEERQLQEMIENGVPEDVAKEVIATSQLRKQLQAKENELKEKEEQTQQQQAKNQEYEDFIKAYPNVKAEDIPKEVYEASQNSSLKQAYTEWKLKQLEQQLAVMQKNKENNESIVGGVTEHDGKTNNQSKDLFLQGFEG